MEKVAPRGDSQRCGGSGGSEIHSKKGERKQRQDRGPKDLDRD